MESSLTTQASTIGPDVTLDVKIGHDKSTQVERRLTREDLDPSPCSNNSNVDTCETDRVGFGSLEKDIQDGGNFLDNVWDLDSFTDGVQGLTSLGKNVPGLTDFARSVTGLNANTGQGLFDNVANEFSKKSLDLTGLNKQISIPGIFEREIQDTHEDSDNPGLYHDKGTLFRDFEFPVKKNKAELDKTSSVIGQSDPDDNLLDFDIFGAEKLGLGDFGKTELNYCRENIPGLNYLTRNVPNVRDVNFEDIKDGIGQVSNVVESVTGISPMDLMSNIPGADLLGWEGSGGDGSSSDGNNDFESVFSDIRSIGGDVVELIADSKQFFTQLGALVGVFGTLVNTSSNALDDYRNGEMAGSVFNIVLLLSVQIPTITAMLFVFLKDKVHISLKGFHKVKEDLKELVEDIESLIGSDDDEDEEDSEGNSQFSEAELVKEDEEEDETYETPMSDEATTNLMTFNESDRHINDLKVTGSHIGDFEGKESVSYSDRCKTYEEHCMVVRTVEDIASTAKRHKNRGKKRARKALGKQRLTETSESNIPGTEEKDAPFNFNFVSDKLKICEKKSDAECSSECLHPNLNLISQSDSKQTRTHSFKAVKESSGGQYELQQHNSKHKYAPPLQGTSGIQHAGEMNCEETTVNSSSTGLVLTDFEKVIDGENIKSKHKEITSEVVFRNTEEATEMPWQIWPHRKRAKPVTWESLSHRNKIKK